MAGGLRTNLRRYILWKIVVAAVLVFLVLTIDFYLLEVVPGDPTRTMLPRGGSSALRSQLIAEWGLDQPVLTRYGVFLANIITGNWGTSVSFRPGMDVWDIMAPAQADTFVLMGASVLLAAAVGLVVGPLLARRRGGWGDGLGSLLALLSVALPVMFVALTLQYLLGIVSPTFPLSGDASFNAPGTDMLAQLGDHLLHLILPVLVLAITLAGPFVLAVRRQWTVEPLDSAQGLVQRLFRAVEKALPSVPLLLGWVISSVVVVEILFGLNGLGRLLYDALLRLDFPLASAVFLVLSMIAIAAVSVFDVLHAALAPHRDEGRDIRPPAARIELEDLGSTARHAFLRPMGVLGLLLLLVIVGVTLDALALVGPYPTDLNRFVPLSPPSQEHPLGTDRVGFDVLTLLVYGGTAPLILASEVFLVALALSVALAVASGFIGGWTDRGVAVGLDLLLVLPWLPLLGVFAMVNAPQRLDAGGILLVALISWAVPARLLRSSASRDFAVGPVRGSGVPRETGLRGMVHRLWSLRGTVLGYAVMTAGMSVLMISAMAMLGLVRSTPISWGQMIGDSYAALDLVRGRWYAFIPPGLAIATLAYGLFLIGFTLRESDHRAARRAVLRPAPGPDPAAGPEAASVPPPMPGPGPGLPPTP